MIYAVDFDGTLCEKAWPNIGAEKPEILNYVKKIKSEGHKVILWTCREGEKREEAEKWCRERGLVFDAVNENLPQQISLFNNDSRKIFADYYIDDKNKLLSECFVSDSEKGVKIMNKYWRIQKAEDSKTADVYLYGDIVGDSVDWWTGEKTKSSTSANTMKEELEGLGQLDTVNLYINSFGGSCYEGHAVANILRRCKAKTVAHIDAYACSVASIIACACDEVRMPRNTVMMIHNAWLPFVSGNSKELRKIADDLDVENSAFKTIYLDKAGDKLNAQTLDKLLDEETYLTAEQCLELGLCDVVETFDATVSEPDDSIKMSATKFGVNAEKVCAMVRSSFENIEPCAPVPEEQEEKPLEKKDFRETAAELFLKKFIGKETKNV